MTVSASERIAEVFVEVSDTLVDDFDLIEFLQMVTVHATRLVPANAAGVVLSDDKGALQVMAASDERAQMLELFQAQSHEGPCQDCFRQGAPVVNADLSAASGRWPNFAPRAVIAGFRSVHAFPLRLRKQVIGALNLFGELPGKMQPDEVRLVQALADVATIGLLQERAIRQRGVLTEQLQAALDSRIAIEQAKGALAQIHGFSPDEAFVLMRTFCRNHQRRLGEVARAVIEEPHSVPDLTSL